MAETETEWIRGTVLDRVNHLVEQLDRYDPRSEAIFIGSADVRHFIACFVHARYMPSIGIKLCRLAGNVDGDDLDVVATVALLQAFRHYNRGSVLKFTSWGIGKMRQACIAELRRNYDRLPNSSRASEVERAPLNDFAETLAIMDPALALVELEASLERLNPKEQLLLQVAIIEQRSHAEIARSQGVNRSTIKRQVDALRLKIQEMLD